MKDGKAVKEGKQHRLGEGVYYEVEQGSEMRENIWKKGGTEFSR